MLADSNAIATIAVKDLSKARNFYGAALGLRELPNPDNPEVIIFESGGTRLMVYRSTYAGTNQATVVTWSVPDLDIIVEALRAGGMVFEHYDLPQLTRHGDVHVAGDGLRVVWFKDPDGNILSILTPPEPT